MSRREFWARYCQMLRQHRQALGVALTLDAVILTLVLLILFRVLR